MPDSNAEGPSQPVDSRLPRYLAALVPLRTPLQVSVDAGAWAVAIWAATLLRYEFELPVGATDGIVTMAIVAVAVQVASGFTQSLYLRRWRYGSFDEMGGVVRSTVFTTCVVVLLNRLLFETAIPLSASMAAGVGALMAMAGVRFTWRVVLDHARRPEHDDATRVLIFGAGEAAQQLVRQMVSDPMNTYLPVGMLDDDPAKANLRIRRVPVVGTRNHLATAVESLDVSMLVVAVPSVGGELVRELYDEAGELELEVRVLPSVNELIGGVAVSHVRPVSNEDLMGRGGIETDLDSIAHYLTGKRVLVTGAGGSIGSELCRQVHRFNPAALLMLDCDEGGLHGVQMSIEGRALLDDPSLIVANIRDRERMAEVFAQTQPHVVFHAAALKHLSLLEMHPSEGVKSNIWGTQNLLELAVEHRVERFVNISTDKAADPTSVLGYTKRIAERLTARAAQDAAGVFLSVRFGNVLGSRGSMLTTFEAQIEAGGPVTVTDPDVTRYFMTGGEAVQLVIQAGAIGRSGEALVLDMGEPVSIDQVARRLIARAKRPVRIVYTGLRPGEKLHEVLLSEGEVDRRPVHPLISHVEVPVIDPETVSKRLSGSNNRLVESLMEVCAVQESATS
ncbi:MAG: polysaccharide biosynthesis protein [Acidimicrobiia bacterium]|nr:polysaccharide biosynthesis protein [Acidimicrobiia bacterium]